MELLFLSQKEKVSELRSIRACLKKQDQLCAALLYMGPQDKAVKITDDGNTVGYIFFPISATGIVNIDIGIHPAYRYQGYGKKSLVLLSEILRNNSDVKEINACVCSDNLPSQRCFESSGFVSDNYNPSDLIIRYRKHINE